MQGDNLIFVFSGTDALVLGAYIGIGATSGVGIALFAVDVFSRAYLWARKKAKRGS